VVCADPAAFDLVLMDINMPVMDGHEASIRIRAAGITLPIVAMTAHALKGHIELCLEKGMDDYIPKYVAVRIVGRTFRRQRRYSPVRLAPAPSPSLAVILHDQPCLCSNEDSAGQWTKSGSSQLC